jgi:cysteine desulfuration protein SufE
VENRLASDPARTDLERPMSDIDEIVDAFEFLDDWDARYQYLIELGEDLAPMQEALKTDENWVKPCMSTVHVAAQYAPGDPSLIRFVGDCDTAIIKGVLALLIDLLSYRTLDEIREMDVDSLFKRLQLEEHLSPNRHVGIYAIVEKMLERASALQPVQAY